MFPAVPSTTVPPGRIRPFSSASLTRYRAARSLIDPPGDMNSALARMLEPVSSDKRFRRICHFSQSAAAFRSQRFDVPTESDRRHRRNLRLPCRNRGPKWRIPSRWAGQPRGPHAILADLLGPSCCCLPTRSWSKEMLMMMMHSIHAAAYHIARLPLLRNLRRPHSQSRHRQNILYSGVPEKCGVYPTTSKDGVSGNVRGSTGEHLHRPQKSGAYM